MRRYQTMLIVAGVVAFCSTAAYAEDYLLYTPQKVEKSEPPASPRDGVLVQSRVIRKGDTLSRLSKEMTGKGSYYPQILLFNKIADPDLIYAGDTLLVPVSAKAAIPKGKARVRHARRKAVAAPVASTSGTETKSAVVTEPPAQPLKPAATSASHPAPAKPVVSAEQRAYDQAKGLFAKKKYARAAEQFEKFLTTYPNSPKAPDAALYKAECYEKMAGI